MPRGDAQIDVRGLEALQARICGIEDGGARQAILVDVVALVAQFRVEVGWRTGGVADDAVDFGENEQLLSGNVELCAVL